MVNQVCVENLIISELDLLSIRHPTPFTSPSVKSFPRTPPTRNCTRSIAHKESIFLKSYNMYAAEDEARCKLEGIDCKSCQ